MQNSKQSIFGDNEQFTKQALEIENKFKAALMSVALEYPRCKNRELEYLANSAADACFVQLRSNRNL